MSDITSNCLVVYVQNLDSVKELKTFLLGKCSEYAAKQREKWQQLLSDESNHVGFLLNERFINIPAQIAEPTFRSLW